MHQTTKHTGMKQTSWKHGFLYDDRDELDESAPLMSTFLDIPKNRRRHLELYQTFTHLPISISMINIINILLKHHLANIRDQPANNCIHQHQRNSSNPPMQPPSDTPHSDHPNHSVVLPEMAARSVKIHTNSKDGAFFWKNLLCFAIYFQLKHTLWILLVDMW